MVTITGTLDRTSPRYGAWRYVFIGETVPLRSSRPVEGRGHDGKVAKFYPVDVSALSPIQRIRLVDYLADSFRLTPAAVRDRLDASAIQSTDVIVPGDGKVILA